MEMMLWNNLVPYKKWTRRIYFILLYILYHFNIICILNKTISAWTNPRNNITVFSVWTIFPNWMISFAVFSGVSSELKLLVPQWITNLSGFFGMLDWIWCFKQFVVAPGKAFTSIRSFLQWLYSNFLHLHVLTLNQK